MDMEEEVDVVKPVDLVGGQGGDEILVFHNPLDHRGGLGWGHRGMYETPFTGRVIIPRPLVCVIQPSFG